jgi:hypothetical protein
MLMSGQRAADRVVVHPCDRRCGSLACRPSQEHGGWSHNTPTPEDGMPIPLNFIGAALIFIPTVFHVSGQTLFG